MFRRSLWMHKKDNSGFGSRNQIKLVWTISSKSRSHKFKTRPPKNQQKDKYKEKTISVMGLLRANKLRKGMFPRNWRKHKQVLISCGYLKGLAHQVCNRLPRKAIHTCQSKQKIPRCRCHQNKQYPSGTASLLYTHQTISSKCGCQNRELPSVQVTGK